MFDVYPGRVGTMETNFILFKMHVNTVSEKSKGLIFEESSYLILFICLEATLHEMLRLGTQLVGYTKKIKNKNK